MGKQTETGGSNYPETTWGSNTGAGELNNPTGRGNTLDPRKRCAPPAGADVPRRRSKRPPKARSSVTPW